MKPAILLQFVLVACPQVLGQCADGACPPGKSDCEWRTRPDDPGRLYLFKSGVQIGGLDVASGQYRSYDAATDIWAEPGDALRRHHLFGVEAGKLSGQERYTLHTEDGAREVAREQAHRIVAKGLEDDSQKLRVTVIGPNDQRKQVIGDLAAAMPELPQWAIVRDYPPSHWATKPSFVTTGAPTIYCQAPTGKVLHRQDEYQGGVEALVGALRKAKNYDPKKDPDLRKGFPFLANIDLAKIVSYVIALAIGVGAALLLINRKVVQ